jgi:thiol-disulfide isomerase/thioredoxin
MRASKLAAALRPLRSTLIAMLPLAVPAMATPRPVAEFTLEHYRGQVLIVDFWASWCKPCRESIPWLNELQARYRDRGLVIVGVNVDAERGDAEKFLSAVPISFEVVFDPGGSLAREFKVPGMPATYLFDRDGMLAASHFGFRGPQRAPFESQVQALLARSRTQ